jgi:hypothetical protein
MTPNEQKLSVKFKLSPEDVTRLMMAGFNTPVKVRKAAKDSKLPGLLSAGAKAALEAKWKK